MRFKKIFFGFIFLLVTLTAVAQQQFNLTQANQKFDQITIKLSTSELNASEFDLAISKLEELQQAAEECIAANKEEISKISTQFSKTKLLKESKSANNTFIFQKRATYEKQLESCEVFKLRVTDAIDAFKKTLAKLKLSTLSEQHTPIWLLFSHSESVQQAKQKDSVGLATVLPHFSLKFFLMTAVVVILSLGLGFLVRIKVNKMIRENLERYIKLTPFVRYSVPFVLFASLSLYFYFYNTASLKPLVYFSSQILVFFMLCSLLSFALPAKDKTRYSFSVMTAQSRQVFVRFVFFAVAAIFALWVRPVLILLEYSYLTVRIFDLLSITLITILFSYLSWAVANLISKNNLLYTFRAFIKAAISIVLVITVVLEWVGYHDIAVFIIKGFYRTVAFAVLYGAFFYIVNHIFQGFLYRYPKFARFFSLKVNRVSIELVFIRYVLYLLLIYSFILLMAYLWSTDPVTVDTVYNIFLDGLSRENFSLSPIRIVYGLSTFALLSLLGRALASHVGAQYQEQGEVEKQVAVSTILIYVTVSISLIISLIVVGVNFTGLAIIAGALSVGVGLGLQDIVNNFVSGIILLIEKPIRPGDRILVGDVEGFVKKVRVRSTQIQTMSKEDVILPNSELVTAQVTNYMFRNKFYRVTCRVGVAYGSDLERVEAALLDIANAHKDVLSESPNQPAVLFREFGDSALIFELWAMISDVNKKYKIASELHVAIDKKFKQEGITIAFPQRDIHIKSESLSSEVK